MMLKITSAVSLAVVVLAGVVLVNGHNDDRQNEQGIAGGVRRLTSLPAQSTVVNGNDNNRNNINRDWLGKYVADHENRRNPNHHRAMVEMLTRYGTAHVGKTLSMEDVKDALAIEFLSQVDGKPIPIAGSEGSLFIGTIGELNAMRHCYICFQFITATICIASAHILFSLLIYLLSLLLSARIATLHMTQARPTIGSPSRRRVSPTLCPLPDQLE